MKSLFYLMYRLSFFIIIILATACQKENSIDEQSEIVYPVSFQVKSFHASSGFLKSAFSKSHLLASNGGATQGYSEGMLYFWSFNSESLAPDIKYRNTAVTSITYNTNSVPNSFPVSTFSFESYAAGKALSITSGKELYIKMPIKDAQEIIRFGLDIGSTNTGPKDFEIFYSTDLGTTYHAISLDNQFSNLTASAKNSYVYELRDKNISGDELWIKFIMKAGDRIQNGTSVGEYATNGGTFRIDNVYLIGIAPVPTSANTVNKLHYYLFHQDKSDVVFSGEVDLATQMNLSFDLPLGKYHIAFISNSSKQSLIFPQNPQALSFYLSNLFSNGQADIYGYVGMVDVKGETNTAIEMKRFYSQIKVEFTDVADLAMVKKIVVTPQHDPFFFAPFVSSLTNPIVDQSSIEFEYDFSTNKQILFHQFMGVIPELVPLRYTIDVYGVNGILRTFELSSTLKNNMQLVFRGELLKDITLTTGFTITKNESWDNQQNSNF